MSDELDNDKYEYKQGNKDNWGTKMAGYYLSTPKNILYGENYINEFFYDSDFYIDNDGWMDGLFLKMTNII